MNKKRSFFFRIVLASLLRRKSRMIIALLAIAIGATILSGLVTIYYDVPRQMGAEFRNYGANMIFTSKEGSDFSLEDIRQGENIIGKDLLVGVTPYCYKQVRINQTPVMAAGTDFTSVKKTSPYWSVQGSYPNADGEILIGAGVAEIYALAEGKSISVTFTPEGLQSGAVSDEENVMDNYIDFKIAGILETGGSEEDYVYMSMSDLEKLTAQKLPFDLAEVSVSAPAAELESLVNKVNASSANVSAKLIKRVTASEATVLGKLQALVLLVTVVVLALTMITVATTMTAVVTERRREIGLKKALGASDKSIITEFLGEELFLGAFGGLLGAVLGFIFAQVISINVFSSSISLRPILIPVTILASMIVTALACLYPINSATRIDSAVVLKGE